MKQFLLKLFITIIVIVLLLFAWWILFADSAYNFRVFIFIICCISCISGYIYLMRDWYVTEKNERLGCLHGKTAAEKNKFFESLHEFYRTDADFFFQQYFDLKLNEKAEFTNYLKSYHQK